MIKSFLGSVTEVDSHFGTAPNRGSQTQMIIDFQIDEYLAILALEEDIFGLAVQACTIIGKHCSKLAMAVNVFEKSVDSL